MPIGKLAMDYASPSSLEKKKQLCPGFSVDNQVLYRAPYISNEWQR